ncbi:hypothetical protein EON67_07600 [archaeon]|nr:MAG: hypothetical protein EON67_07600 [archaeon]
MASLTHVAAAQVVAVCLYPRTLRTLVAAARASCAGVRQNTNNLYARSFRCRRASPLPPRRLRCADLCGARIFQLDPV